MQAETYLLRRQLRPAQLDFSILPVAFPGLPRRRLAHRTPGVSMVGQALSNPSDSSAVMTGTFYHVAPWLEDRRIKRVELQTHEEIVDEVAKSAGISPAKLSKLREEGKSLVEPAPVRAVPAAEKRRRAHPENVIAIAATKASWMSCASSSARRISRPVLADSTAPTANRIDVA